MELKIKRDTNRQYGNSAGGGARVTTAERIQNRVRAVRRLLARGDREVRVSESSTQVMVEDPVDGGWTIYDAALNYVIYADSDGVGGKVLPLPEDSSAALVAAVVNGINHLEDWL